MTNMQKYAAELALLIVCAVLFMCMSACGPAETEPASETRYFNASVDGTMKNFEEEGITASNAISSLISISGYASDNSSLQVVFCSSIKKGTDYNVDYHDDNCMVGSFQIIYKKDKNLKTESNVDNPDIYTASESVEDSSAIISLQKFNGPGNPMKGSFTGTLCNNLDVPECIKVKNGTFMATYPVSKKK